MSTAKDTDIGAVDRIRMAMKTTGTSMKRLAEETGMPYRTIQNYLSGKHALPASALHNICKVMKLSADWVLFGEFWLNDPVLREAVDQVFGDVIYAVDDISKLTPISSHRVLDLPMSDDRRLFLHVAANQINTLYCGFYDLKLSARRNK